VECTGEVFWVSIGHRGWEQPGCPGFGENRRGMNREREPFSLGAGGREECLKNPYMIHRT